MADFKCLECGTILTKNDLDIDLKKQGKANFELIKKGEEPNQIAMRCLNCGAFGPDHFVCADCGFRHLWKPGKCNRTFVTDEDYKEELREMTSNIGKWIAILFVIVAFIMILIELWIFKFI